MSDNRTNMSLHDSTWEKGECEGVISIGTHSLFLSVAGPERLQGQPLVIVEAGMGDGSLWWKAFQRLVITAGLARIMTYDRAGLGQSEPSPLSRSAENMARELDALLEAAHLPGPYIVITHSYGGIIAREFLERRILDVVGMVFVDAEQENSFKVLNPPWEILFKILGDLDYYSVVGLDDDNKLLPEEWLLAKAEADRTKSTRDAEDAICNESCELLGKKQQLQNHILGDHPVAVMKANSLQDYQRIYNAGTAAGHGTESERKIARDCMERMRTKEEPLMREILDLSHRQRFSHVDTGHNVPVSQPAAIVEELRWVLDSLR
ncbi:alpha/beta-hydrolase [Stipitochalara longipes BDJ]|nr:alpha/beta-hydrolase [Stipitochalara longipes BDJ]